MTESRTRYVQASPSIFDTECPDSPNTTERKLKECYKILVKDYKDKLANHVDNFRKHGALCDKLHNRCEILLNGLEKTRLDLNLLVSDHNERVDVILSKYVDARQRLIERYNEERLKLDEQLLRATTYEDSASSH